MALLRYGDVLTSDKGRTIMVVTDRNDPESIWMPAVILTNDTGPARSSAPVGNVQNFNAKWLGWRRVK